MFLKLVSFQKCVCQLMVISPLVNCALATENLVDLLQVVELDGVVGDVAKRHFGFIENERMQVFQRAP